MIGMRRTRGRAAGALLAALLAGCAPEERVVRYKPFLANLPDAKTGQPAVGVEARRAPEAGPDDDGSIIRNRDGSVTLVSKSIRQLMRHIERTLDNEEDDLFFEQLVADATKQHLRAEGIDPREFVSSLRERRRDIAVLFARLPVGEYSPGAVFEPVGDRMYVVRLTGPAARDIRFTKLWVALEKGQYKLVWFS